MFVWLLLYRAVNALVVDTYFSADEYYQSLEVAHKIVFGTPSKLPWEWSPDTTLRGYLHPLVFAALYKLMQLLGITYPSLYVILPRLLQSVFAAIGDYYVYKVAQKWFRDDVAKYALICSVTNWFHFYCGVRTFSNSMETPFFVIMLYHFPLFPFTFKKVPTANTWYWIFFAGLSCVMRPTNALMCAPLFINHLLFIQRTKGTSATIQFIATRFVPLLVFWIGASIALDSYMYGRFAFVVLSFLKFNVLENRSHMYGTQPWHWYFSQGLPAMVLTHGLLIIWLLFYRLKNTTWPNPGSLKPLYLVLWVCGVYSLLAHKEFRFLYPILPLSFIYAGKAIQQMKLAHARWYNVMWFIVILPHVLFAAYFGLLHQRGTIAAMGTLRDDAENISSVDFLMPCHHAPGYAHLHVGKHIPMRHLDCSPTSDNTMDEADVFHENPLQFVKNTYKTAIPSHIVLYQDMGDKLAPYLREKKFKKIASHFHMYLPHVHDRRMSEYVDVYKRDV